MVIILVDTCRLRNRQNNHAVKEIKKKKRQKRLPEDQLLDFPDLEGGCLKARSCKQFSSSVE